MITAKGISALLLLVFKPDDRYTSVQRPPVTFANPQSSSGVAGEFNLETAESLPQSTLGARITVKLLPPKTCNHPPLFDQEKSSRPMIMQPVVPEESSNTILLKSFGRLHAVNDRSVLFKQFRWTCWETIPGNSENLTTVVEVFQLKSGSAGSQ
jgi:hypothetical protein